MSSFSLGPFHKCCFSWGVRGARSPLLHYICLFRSWEVSPIWDKVLGSGERRKGWTCVCLQCHSEGKQGLEGGWGMWGLVSWVSRDRAATSSGMAGAGTREEGPRQHLLDEVDAGLQVHAEVNELPLDALLLVLLLLQHEHVVVEELLQLLVGEVDAQLLEAVELQAGTGRSGSGGQGSVARGVGPGMHPAWQRVWLASLWSGQGGSAPKDIWPSPPLGSPRRSPGLGQRWLPV